MVKKKNSTLLSSILSAPRRWIVNIIGIQEKKEYHFYVILLFAFFIGITRYMLEFIFGYQPLLILNVSMLNFVVFYLQSIFIYALILRIFVPEQSWRKSINIVLIGVFLGIFPPVIDVFVYGPGNLAYTYSHKFIEDWRPLLFNEKINFTYGETITLFLTMFFTSVVVYIKTRRITRALLSFAVAYGFVFYYAFVQPATAYTLGGVPRVMLQQEYLFDYKDLFSIGGFLSIGILTMLQIATTVVIYLILNPRIALNMLKRVNHALPAALTCLMGYSLIRAVDVYGMVTAALFFFAFLVGSIQNDYFDRVEDEVEGRPPYLEKSDVLFFNAMLLFVAAVFIFSGNIVGYLLLLFELATFLYNFDFYRAKRYFPSNNKIEGVAGVSSFLGGLCMAFIAGTNISGDILNIQNPRIFVATGAFHFIKESLAQLCTVKNILIIFLVFGGWFVISIVKDYKDIRGDTAAGNQTMYTMLGKRGKDVYLFHRVFSLVIFVLLFIPPVWFVVTGLDPFFAVCMGVTDALLLFVITRKDAKKAVQLGFLMLNIYLMWIVIGNHLLQTALAGR